MCGNIRTVVPDIKEPQTADVANAGTLFGTLLPLNYLTDNDNFRLPTLTLNNYYPYGMLQAGRSRNAGGYRFGFQGQEADNKIGGLGQHLNYTFRNYDSWIIRFGAIDPLAGKYPHNSSYAFSENRVIDGVELEGLEYLSVKDCNIGHVESNCDGTYNLSVGGKTFASSGIYTFNGQDYYKVNSDIFDTGNGIATSGKASEQITKTFIRRDQLIEMFPNASNENLTSLESNINRYGTDYGIKNNNILAHYLGQADIESGGFTMDVTEENVNYCTIDRVKKIFHKRPSVIAAVEANPSYYLANEWAFANMAYANSNGNGNEASEDGYNFRGRGYFQLTGRSNYQAFCDFYAQTYLNRVDFLSTPSLIATDRNYAIISSLWYFKTNTIRSINNGASFDDITKTINGPKVDLEGRKSSYKNALNILKR